MLITEYKALFVHIPKTAGQSVENYMLECLGKRRETNGSDFLLRPNDNPKFGPPRLAHLTVKEYVKYGYVTQEDFDGYFKFSFVRNPWERIISFYRYYGFSNLIKFPVFVKKYLPLYFEKEHWFFRPQVEFIFDESDVLQVDFLGRMETLKEDFDTVTRLSSIPKGILPHNNVSEERGIVSKKSLFVVKKHPKVIIDLSFSIKKSKDYSDLYSTEAKKIVEKYYERDIELLKYKY